MSNKLSNSYVRFEKTDIDFEVNDRRNLNFYQLLRFTYKNINPTKKRIKNFFCKVRMYCEMSPK